MQLIIAFVIAVLMNAVATVLIKIGSAKLPAEFSIKTIFEMIRNPHIWGGVLLYIGSFPPYIFIFKHLKVSIAYPIFASLAFAGTIVIAFIFLKESLTIWQIFGLVLLVGGIFLLATNGA